MIEGIRRLFRLGGSQRGVEGEVEDELTFHLESRVEELMANGMDEDAARRRARAEFGDVIAAKSELAEIGHRRARKERRRNLLDDLRQDVRHALRSLARRPSYTAVGVLTLALGIGSATAIFAFVDAVLLRPFPFPEPDRLVVIWGVAGPERDIRGASYPEVTDWRERTRSFSSMSLYDETTLNLSGAGEAEQLEAETVSPGYFEMLGAKPVLGRMLLPEDDAPNITAPVVISHDLWRRRFDGRSDILGSALTLDGRQAVVVGVAEPGFHGLSFDTDIWAPLLPFSPGAGDSRGTRWLAALGRLAPGATREGAQSELEAATVAMESDYPDTNRERRADLITLHEYFLRTARTLMLALLGAVGLLLLMACVNVLNLQLVRGLARDREVAVRYALGARRSRVMRQILTESLVLAGLGGIAGLAVAWWGVRSIIGLVPAGVVPAYAQVSLDPRVLAVAALIVAVAGVFSGSLPAVRGSRRELGAALRSADRSGAGEEGTRTFGLQHGLVAVQMALALALMLGATVMIRSVRAQLRVDPGFEPDGVVAARVFLPRESYPDAAARLRFRDRVVDGLRGRPGVQAVAVGSDAPLRGNNSAAILRVPDARGDEGIRFYRHMVSPEFFETIGVRITRGRGFEPTDVADAPGVVVVSHAFAEKLWPGRDPIGERIEIPGGQATVVGVAADTRYRDLTTALMDPGEDPDVWFSFDQIPSSTFDIIVRRAAGTPPDAEAIRRAVAAVDPSIPIFQVSTLRDALGNQTATDRLGAVLLGVFGAAALALAAIGLFGVMSFVVSMRRREIAIRIALGSTPRAVLGRVLRQGLATVSLGIAAGLAAAIAGGRVIAGILFGVSPLDPLSIGVVLLVLALAAVTATLIPASRASRTDPQGVLRGD